MSMQIINQNQQQQEYLKTCEKQLESSKKSGGLYAKERQLENTQKLKSIFAIFSACWGQKWLKSFEEAGVYQAALEQWIEIFDVLTDENIKFAIRNCKNLYDFPPSYSQFLAAGLGIPCYAVAKRGRDGGLFCDILWQRIGKTSEMTTKELNYHIKDCYDALREEFLLDECREKTLYEKQQQQQ